MTREDRRRSPLVLRPSCCIDVREELAGTLPAPPRRDAGRELRLALPRTPDRCRPLPLQVRSREHGDRIRACLTDVTVDTKVW